MTNSDIGTAPAGQEQALYTAPFLMTAATHEGKRGDETSQRIEANTSKQHHRHHRLIEWFSRVEPAELDLNPRNAPTPGGMPRQTGTAERSSGGRAESARPRAGTDTEQSARPIYLDE